MKYTIIRDNQEKANKWEFSKSKYCDGVIDQHLLTGDYTLLGYEDRFIIEKKSSTGEFSGNIFDPAFERELTRMNEFEFPFVICEFTMDDIAMFPKNSGIPQKIWRKLRTNKHVLLKRFLELQMSYRAKFILAGAHGHDVARSLFKRIMENVPIS